jgi:hypothetical protein
MHRGLILEGELLGHVLAGGPTTSVVVRRQRRIVGRLRTVCRALRAMLGAALHVVLLRTGTRRRRVTWFVCRRRRTAA